GRRDHGGGDQAPRRGRWASTRASSRLSRGAPSGEHRGDVSRGGAGVWERRAAEWPRSRPPPRCRQGSPAGARGDSTHRAASPGRRDEAFAEDGPARIDDVARHPVTTVARTLVDLAGILSLDALA